MARTPENSSGETEHKLRLGKYFYQHLREYMRYDSVSKYVKEDEEISPLVFQYPTKDNTYCNIVMANSEKEVPLVFQYIWGFEAQSEDTISPRSYLYSEMYQVHPNGQIDAWRSKSAPSAIFYPNKPEQRPFDPHPEDLLDKIHNRFRPVIGAFDSDYEVAHHPDMAKISGWEKSGNGLRDF